MSAREASFRTLAKIPVHYDRLVDYPYGSRGKAYDFYCQEKLKNTLNKCFKELFSIWKIGIPEYILSAGTIGDNDNEHGKGLAFDLDGFFFKKRTIMMSDFTRNRIFYLGINAHLYLYFSNVLNYYHRNHRDHFHMDFNYSYNFRTASNIQTFFIQSVLCYFFDKDLGDTGADKDGVDGVYGSITKASVRDVLKDMGLYGDGGLTNKKVWKKFLLAIRNIAFGDVKDNAEVFDQKLSRIDLRHASNRLLGFNDNHYNSQFLPLPEYGVPSDVVYLISQGGSYLVPNEIKGFIKDAINIKSSDVLLNFSPLAKIEATTDNTTKGGHRDSIQLIPPLGLHYAGYLLDSIFISNAKIISKKESYELQGITGFDGLFRNINISHVEIFTDHPHGIIFNGLISGVFEEIEMKNPIKLQPCRLCGGKLSSIWLAEPFLINGEELKYESVDQFGNVPLIIDNRIAFSQLRNSKIESESFEETIKGRKGDQIYSHVDLTLLWDAINASQLLENVNPADPQILSFIKEFVANSDAVLVYEVPR